MRIALINSGIGLLATAAVLHRLRPDADLVLAMDPDGMPWGPRSPGDIAQRSLACARATAAFGPLRRNLLTATRRIWSPCKSGAPVLDRFLL